MTYYFVQNNERKGPYELEELKAMGVITPDTLVWTNGMPDWAKASEVADMHGILNELNQAAAATDYSAYQPQPDPVQPQYQEPVQPQYQEPVQPQYQEPVQPQYQEPVQPQYQEPVQPQYQEPVQPQYQEPVQPQYQEPVQPQYQQPMQPQYQQPMQPQYQQPMQPQYQQPYQQPYEAPKKKKSKAWLWILLGLIVALVAAMAITNPGKRDHVKEIEKEMTKLFDEAGSEVSAIMGMMSSKIGPMLENELEYHNYVLFSTVTDKNGERLSWGLFGNVWANLDKDGKTLKELKESIDKLKNLGGSLGTTPTDSDSDYATDDDDAVATTPGDNEIPDQGDIVNQEDLDKLNDELNRADDELNDALNELQREIDKL